MTRKPPGKNCLRLGGIGRESSGFFPKIEIAPCGHTARQCWHLQHPLQPKRSNSFMYGYSSSPNSITMPEQVLMHFPHLMHFDLSTTKCAFDSAPTINHQPSQRSFHLLFLHRERYKPHGCFQNQKLPLSAASTDVHP